jgi:hypothetical protein
MLRDRRGQTAAEYLGALLLVAAIIAAIVPRQLAHEIHSLVCQIAGGD